MQDPTREGLTVPQAYAVLDVAQGADDAAIRAAYLSQVRAHPPDLDPGRFRQVRAAYETLRNRRERMRQALFGDAQIPDVQPTHVAMRATPPLPPATLGQDPVEPLVRDLLWRAALGLEDDAEKAFRPISAPAGAQPSARPGGHR